MQFRVLGCQIEYHQAAKRLEEIAQAHPGTSLAEEQKTLIKLFRDFEREVLIPEKRIKHSQTY